MESLLDFNQYPLAFGKPECEGIIKNEAKDFFVKEILPFQLTGKGDHLYLLIRKTNISTQEVCKLLSSFSGLEMKNISYSGLKDKRAICEQWISLKTDIDDDWDNFRNENLEILQTVRNQKKLRRGTHKSNRFEIRVSTLQGDIEGLLKKIERVRQSGVPNYFGPQRLGFNNDNVRKAIELFKHKNKHIDKFRYGIYLSAGRSYVFNMVLAKRVECKNWNKYLAGDLMSLDGTRSFFISSAQDPDIPARLAANDIHPTGPLWGQGDPKTREEAINLEKEIANKNQILCDGLAASGLKQERRATRLKVGNFQYEVENPNTILLKFELISGAFATSVLRELVNFRSNDNTSIK